MSQDLRSPSANTADRDHITDVYAVAIRGPVLFQIWERGTPLDGARVAVELARALAASAEPATATLIVVPDGSGLPDGETRGILSEIPTALGRGVGVGMAREGTGFQSAAIRAILTGIMLVGRHKVPHDVFSTVEEAAAWVAGKLQGRVTPGELVAQVNELRTRIR